MTQFTKDNHPFILLFDEVDRGSIRFTFSGVRYCINIKNGIAQTIIDNIKRSCKHQIKLEPTARFPNILLKKMIRYHKRALSYAELFV